MIYRFIKNHETVFPIEKMCKFLGIGLRSYYDWKSSGVSDRKHRAMLLQEKVKAVYFNKKQRYGSPRIAMELRARGDKISRVTVAKYMKQMGLRSKLGRKFRTTTDSQYTHKIMENILDREFTVSEVSKGLGVGHHLYPHKRRFFIFNDHYRPLRSQMYRLEHQ